MHKPIEEKQVILGHLQLQANVAMQILQMPPPVILTVGSDACQSAGTISLGRIEKQVRTEAARFLRDLLKQRPGM